MIRKNIGKIKQLSEAERITSLCLIIIVSGLLFSGAKAQTNAPAKSQEIFTTAYGLITNSLSATKRTVYDISENETIKIYNADGSIWYEFSLFEKSALYFKKIPNADFKPLVPLRMFIFYIRLKAISQYRYQVVVNEETQETKYMFVNDTIIGRETLEQYLLRNGRVTFDNGENPLRESPNGEIIKNIEVSDEVRFMPYQIDGDWLELRIAGSREGGWVRWRKDNRILVCCVLGLGKK